MTNICRLQGIQNSLCRIVTCTSWFSNIIPHLIDLHRLNVCQRIYFKRCLLIFKCLQTDLPPYFHSGLTPYSCLQNTRGSNPYNNYLTTVSFDHKFLKSKRLFDNCFSVGAPHTYNSLPFIVRTATLVSGFRHLLKANLFDLAYPERP